MKKGNAYLTGIGCNFQKIPKMNAARYNFQEMIHEWITMNMKGT